MSTCPECGHEIQIGDFPFCEPGGGHSPARSVNASLFDPVVIHRDAAGNIRYPANGSAPVPEGYQRVELRTVHEVRKFEAEVNQREHAASDQHLSAREKQFSEKQAANRRELRTAMDGMSNYGRDFAREAIERGNNRRAQTREVGFHLDVFSNNSSNREVHRDERTQWKGRKG
jgi:hypothetical protein